MVPRSGISGCGGPAWFGGARWLLLAQLLLPVSAVRQAVVSDVAARHASASQHATRPGFLADDLHRLLPADLNLAYKEPPWSPGMPAQKAHHGVPPAFGDAWAPFVVPTNDSYYNNSTYGEDGPFRQRMGYSNSSDYWPADDHKATFKEVLLALGSGSGLNYDPDGHGKQSRRTLREMCYQHAATTFLIIGFFFLFILTNLRILYWQVERRVSESSSVKFYADVSGQVGLSESTDFEDFLEAFSKPPQAASLAVTGLLEATPAEIIRGNFDYTILHGRFQRVAFSFSLDLTPWLVCNESSGSQGMAREDCEALESFLQENGNDLASVVVQKDLVWSDWEELAMNVKSRLRQRGFRGRVLVTCQGTEEVVVRKNCAWAHFVRSRMTRALVALSIVGWLLFELYVWCRSSRLVVRSKHRVNMSIHEYWELVGSKLTSEGFDESSSIEQLDPPSRRPSAPSPQP
eukprot:TRINITY_DN91948_c0_g1_i1.p1 TRINITY_DN91948_c0_g1~~TRINITY_DN91948_c0_g1_i1.p1  ORF type:complete len:461 (-),score=90.25 TRINITY_DN91948_c0_g1_i1:81-1463(-)